MNKKRLLTDVILALAVTLTIFLTWLLRYPYQLWAKEANGFFAWTHDYFSWIWFEHLPFLSTFAGDWLTQLFRFPALGALVEALIALLALVAVIALLRRYHAPQWLDVLSTLAALGIWYKQFDEESLTFTLPAACFLLMLAAVVSLPRWWRIAAVVLTFFLLPFPVFTVWIAIASLLTLLDRFLAHRREQSDSAETEKQPKAPWYLSPILSLLFLAVTAVYINCSSAFGKTERCNHIQFLAATDRWDALSNLVGGSELCDNTEAPYLLLALSHEDRLGDYIFHYPVNSEEYFLYAGYATRDAYFFNQLFYSQIGLINEAIHMAYQEKTRTRYPMSFRVLMSLIKLETIRGDYRQASKYLDLLDQASFYHTWVAKHRPSEEQLSHPIDHSTDATFFITDSTLKNLHYAATIGNGNLAAQTYYLCALLIRKNLLAFVNHLKEHPEVMNAGLPNHFWEAIILADSQGFHIDNLTMYPGLYDRFMDFQHKLGAKDRDAILSEYNHTYWFNYYFLTFPEDTNPNPGIIRREQ